MIAAASLNPDGGELRGPISDHAAVARQTWLPFRWVLQRHNEHHMDTAEKDVVMMLVILFSIAF
jgi:hypothetical protein